MKTPDPIRTVRISDDLWKQAQRVAGDLAEQAGLSATASDVVRKALVEFIERHNTAKRAARRSSQA